MNNVMDFDQYAMNESKKSTIYLTDEEKDLLWSKLETVKKAKEKNTNGEVYSFLNGTSNALRLEMFHKILNMLEYSFKKRLRSGEGFSRGKYKESFDTISKKLPKDWFGVNSSSLKARETRLNRKPTTNSKKEDIVDYLRRQQIEFDPKLSKKELVKLIK